MIGTLVALPFGLFLVHCSGNSDNADAPPQKNGNQIIYTSSRVDGHIHTFALDVAAFTAPPAAGVTGSTSVGGGHTHALSITTAQLQSVNGGQSLMVTTQSASGHTHVFTFVKVA
jgi:hypothetical protein